MEKFISDPAKKYFQNFCYVVPCWLKSQKLTSASYMLEFDIKV